MHGSLKAFTSDMVKNKKRMRAEQEEKKNVKESEVTAVCARMKDLKPREFSNFKRWTLNEYIV
jgi:hypothetical protein